MKERPILFSGPMVRKINADEKFQTRRVMKPQPAYPDSWSSYRFVFVNGGFDCYLPNGTVPDRRLFCPQGKPGDRLWVRESFQPLLADGVKWLDADYETGEGYAINYVASDGVKEFVDCSNDDEISSKITPSIFMPRWASRITLEITEVRFQRLQDITEEDAIAEGFGPRSARALFRGTWDVLNSKRGFGWDVNPWVWAITFKRVHQ